MKGKTRIACIMLVSSSLLLSGCSFSSTMQGLVSKITKDSSQDATEVVVGEGTKVEPKTVDGNLERPVFDNALVRLLDVPVGTPADLETEAQVSDGGTVTYQWFSNNVNANGGGTAIPEATDRVYHADTSAGGTTFYYVVATNTLDGRVNMSTSEVYSVTVWEDMYWQQNADLGSYQYMSRINGKFPVATSMVIDGKSYLFDADGFAVTETGEYLDVQTGEPVATPTPEPTPTPTPTPTPEPEEETEDQAATEEGAETTGEETYSEEYTGEEG